jgi:hypothetical protein
MWTPSRSRQSREYLIQNNQPDRRKAIVSAVEGNRCRRIRSCPPVASAACVGEDECAVPGHRRHAASPRRCPRTGASRGRSPGVAACGVAPIGRRGRPDHGTLDSRCGAAVSGLKLAIAGQHGCNRRSADGTIHRRSGPLPGLSMIRRTLKLFAERHRGILFEDKGSTFAVHYRLAPESRALGPSDAARIACGNA